MTTRKVLVVDDEPIMRELVRQVNNALGYETLQAADGLEGFHVYQNNLPDLVISDVYMPRSDGVQLLKNIRTIDPTARIILMTGHAHFRMTEEKPLHRPNGFLLKPFALAELMNMIQAILTNLKPEEKPEHV
jgi:YesN/AraC family two-component response regulator